MHIPDGYLSLIISMAFLAFSSTLPMFILVAVIWGIGSAFLYPALVAYAIDRAGSSRGPAVGTFQRLPTWGRAWAQSLWELSLS
jgi:MFS family permease